VTALLYGRDVLLAALLILGCAVVWVAATDR
jgi:hypothetical protein